MKRLIFNILLLLFNTSVLLSQSRIRITNGEWEPYLSEFSYEYGLASHIVCEAFKLEGIEIEWGFFPWKRSYEVVRIGEWDASAVWWPSEDARKDFLISDPVIDTSFVFFHLKGNEFTWEEIVDLKDMRIGITRGYYYGIAFMEAVKNKVLLVYEDRTDEKNFQKLLLNRIDVFPNDQLWATTKYGTLSLKTRQNCSQTTLRSLGKVPYTL